MPLWPQGGNGYDCRARLLFPRDSGWKPCPAHTHTHTITRPLETLYDANVQISNGGPWGNLSHLSQSNSLRTGVKHSRLWSLKHCYCSLCYCSTLMDLWRAVRRNRESMFIQICCSLSPNKSLNIEYITHSSPLALSINNTDLTWIIKQVKCSIAFYLKGIVHPKMKIMSLITHPHVVLNP